MRWNERSVAGFAAACMTAILVVSSAQANQHAGDFVVGVTGQGQLSFEKNLSPPVFCSPASGLFQGWTTTDSGFERLFANQPEDDLFILSAGCDIRLEVVTIPEGMKVWYLAAGELADAPGERISLGGNLLHTHPTWHMDSSILGSGYVAGLTASFRLIDLGSTNYAASDAFTMSFANLLIPGDSDLDGDVDLTDLAILASRYGSAEAMAWRHGDFDADEDVDLTDLAILASHYGESAFRPVPEPVSAMMMSCCLALGAGRLKRRQQGTPTGVDA